MTSSSGCPSAAMLSAWLDDELDSAGSEAIRGHLAGCASCRALVLGWVDAVTNALPRGLQGERRPEGPREALRSQIPSCLDEEVLVAYTEGELREGETEDAERHLQRCASCVHDVQRLVHLRVAMTAESATRSVAARAGGGAIGRVIACLRDWVEGLEQVMAKPWQLLGAVAATAALLLVVTRFVPNGDDIRFRGASEASKVEVMTDGAIARARPGGDQPVIATLEQGTVVAWLEESGGWTRIELADGRRVWLRSEAVGPTRGTAR